MAPSSDVPERLTGVIKTALSAKKYGFISAQGGGDYFFHKSALRGVKFEDLIAGDVVSFIPTEGKHPGQKKAVDVTRRDDGSQGQNQGTGRKTTGRKTT
jgi:cold shock CspA family protein